MNNLTEDYLNDLLDLEAEEGKDEEIGNNNHELPEGEDGEPDQGAIVEEVSEKDRLQQKQGTSNLLTNLAFVKHLQKIDKFAESGSNKNSKSVDEVEYIIITKSAEYVGDLDREIGNIHKYIKDIYFAKFPELESLILNPIEFINCVMLIKNETDMNKIDLASNFSSHLSMAVSLSGSSTQGKPLSEKDLARCLEACELVLKLNDTKRSILGYIESRMHYLAPNLSEITGPTTAAALLAAAGGLEALARIPACNIQVIGNQKKNLLGFSRVGQKNHLGLFGEMEMVKKAPNDFKTKLVKLLANNCAKAVRVDASRLSQDGSIGKELKAKMLASFDKSQEPNAPKMKKPLPAPDDKPKKRRGGKRYRKMKEKFGLTDLRKMQNRLKFGEDGEDQFRESGIGFGMISKNTGIGKVKITTRDNKLSLSKKQQLNLSKNMGGNTGGLTSSIVFTPMQGMSLINPAWAQKVQEKKAPENYFNKESGFRTVIQAKQKASANLANLGQ